jgi:hypothetical protein
MRPNCGGATEEFLDEARTGKYNLFISVVVFTEIARAKEELAARLRNLIKELDPVVLELDDEIDQLAQAFLEHGVVPPSKVEDAQHVAAAVVHDLDVLVSWNYRHLVNMRRREEFQRISVMNGYYKALQIVTPPEVPNER